jgi:hypothetical protein
MTGHLGRKDALDRERNTHLAMSPLYRGVSGMDEAARVEVEFDDRRYAALEREAQRLGLDVPMVVYRATAAWLCEMSEHGHLDMTTTEEIARA